MRDISKYGKVTSLKNSDLTQEEFYTVYNEPFIMTEVTKEWPALQTFKLTSLIEHYPYVCESVEVSDSQKIDLTIKDYAELIEKKQTAGIYFKTQFHLHTKLKLDYVPPRVFNCWYAQFPQKSKKFILSWIYIGGEGTMSFLHRDLWNTSAWNVVISGLKLWMFFPPENTNLLYNGKVNPFEPDLEKFPDFANTKPLIAVQEPGQLVYTPSRWWHAVYNLKSGVSLTENFINETNIENVKEYFSEHGQYKSLESIENIAEYYQYKS